MTKVAEASLHRDDFEAKVLEFINQRPGYVKALRDTGGSGDWTDYYRWTGHAEARRQLANALGLTVPYERGEKAVPKSQEPSGG